MAVAKKPVAYATEENFKYLDGMIDAHDKSVNELHARVAAQEKQVEEIKQTLAIYGARLTWLEFDALDDPKHHKKQNKLNINWRMVWLDVEYWFENHGRGLFIGVVLAVAGFAVGYVW